MVLLEEFVDKGIVISMISLAPIFTELDGSNNEKQTEKATGEGEERDQYIYVSNLRE